ncbi:MAG: AAA family ATPase [Streptosporangiales bacterium]|nr:AAA family ATPase [Streptosporangiales bacterium]
MTDATNGNDANPGPYAAVHETHAAVVIVLGDRVYKVKKPVDLGFLDYSTREARQAICRREVELNRRLAPDVYLGVADVYGVDGEPCDHLVVMRRMPDDRRLSTLVRSGVPVREDLRRLARILAAFHASADRSPEISAEGSRDALRDRWVASFDQVRSFHGTVLDPAEAEAVERLTLRFLAGREPLFAARIRDGHVLDGHGDLLADDIFCLDDGPRALDCLEFDDRLRWVDGLDDAAFLAMNLEHLGAPSLAEHFMGSYVEFAGDPAPPALQHHYVAYRAFVRAKVACLRSAQGDHDAAGTARELTRMTLRHLQAGAAALVLVGGLPGTGKTTLAGVLADRLGATLLSSDRVRKELAGLPPEQSAAAGYEEGIYRRDHTARTYEELLERAEKLLGLGETVVIDASWTHREHRDHAADVAARTHSELIPLRCHLPTEAAAERLSSRARGPSDADAAIAAAMAETADPWPEAAVVDTGDRLEESVERALAAVHPHVLGATWQARRPQMPPD